MGKTLKTALLDTLPVMTGYVVLGFGFGVVMSANGFGVLFTAAMSTFLFAGSMQYAAVPLLTSGASLLTLGLTTLMVNARHLFYGVSMLEKYKGMGKRKPYLIFALTDETYSLVCHDKEGLSDGARRDYYLFVSLLDQLWWVLGSVLGAAVGTLVSFNSEGVDFALTALFITVFLEQWLTAKKHTGALVGLGASLLCLAVFGSDRFLIPAMLLIALTLGLKKEEQE